MIALVFDDGRGDSYSPIHIPLTPRLYGVSADLLIIGGKYRDIEDAKAGVLGYLSVTDAEELIETLSIGITLCREQASNEAYMSPDEWELFNLEVSDKIEQLYDQG